jgi:cell division protein FtsL
MLSQLSLTKLNVSLLIALLLCAFALINSQHRARKLFHELETAQQKARQLDIERDQLEVEQSKLASAGQVAKVAQRDLKMQRITPPQTLYVDLTGKTLATAPAVPPAGGVRP